MASRKADRFFSLGRGKGYFDTEQDKQVTRYARDKIVRGAKRATKHVARKKRVPPIRISKFERGLLAKDFQAYQVYLGKKISLKDAVRTKEFREIIAALKTKSRTAKGVKARALVKLGRRDPNWAFAVGETPDTMGRAATTAALNLRLAEAEDAGEIEREIKMDVQEKKDKAERRRNKGRVRR